MSTKTKLSTGLSAVEQVAKKAETKKRGFPYNPYREKAKGKETSRGFYENPLSPRARDARSCVRTCEGVSRYKTAGAAAREIMSILGSTKESDHRIWATYCRYVNPEDLIEIAHTYASYYAADEINDPIKAFQRCISKKYKNVPFRKSKSARGGKEVL